MAASLSQAAADATYPPLPESGPPEDSNLAQTNFSERERLSKSWRFRLLSKRRSGLTLLKKRNTALKLDRESSGSSSSESLDDIHGPSEGVTISAAGPLQNLTSEAQAERPSDVSQITIIDPTEVDASRDQHLYCWAMVYENQRGISVFSARRYSSRSLLPRDPPAFSIVAPASSIINNRPVRKSLQPDISLMDFPLPDGNWRWASKEWMIDMRGDAIQHDGFEYNWFFRSKGWRSRAGHLNAGAWVRRRRWIRLMERPPLSTLKDGEELAKAAKKGTLGDRLDLDSIWLGNGEDWPRLRRAMNELGHDRRKLDAWEGWLDATKRGGNNGIPSNPIAESMRKVLLLHTDELFRSFIYPLSRIELLKMAVNAGILNESEARDAATSHASFVDLPRLQDALILIRKDS